jgi:hypothetical protein
MRLLKFFEASGDPKEQFKKFIATAINLFNREAHKVWVERGEPNFYPEWNFPSDPDWEYFFFPTGVDKNKLNPIHGATLQNYSGDTIVYIVPGSVGLVITDKGTVYNTRNIKNPSFWKKINDPSGLAKTMITVLLKAPKEDSYSMEEGRLRLLKFLQEEYYGTRRVKYNTKGVDYTTKGENYTTKNVDYTTFSDTEYGMLSKGKDKKVVNKMRKKKQHSQHGVPQVSKVALQGGGKLYR